MQKKSSPYTVSTAYSDIDSGQIGRIYLDSLLAGLPYHQDFSKIHAGVALVERFYDPTNYKHWAVSDQLAFALNTGHGLAGLTIVTGENNVHFLQSEQGLVAYVLLNSVANEIRIIFGGTTSGEGVGGLLTRTLKNLKPTVNHWVTNVENAVSGAIPVSYLQAKRLVTTLLGIANNRSVVVSGHSKGAAEAAYAAIMQETPLQAECFCSAEFGRDLMESIPETKKQAALGCINHYFIKGDHVSDVGASKAGGAALSLRGHIGQTFIFPGSGGSLKRHDRFTEQIKKLLCR